MSRRRAGPSSEGLVRPSASSGSRRARARPGRGVEPRLDYHASLRTMRIVHLEQRTPLPETPGGGKSDQERVAGPEGGFKRGKIAGGGGEDGAGGTAAWRAVGVPLGEGVWYNGSHGADLRQPCNPPQRFVAGRRDHAVGLGDGVHRRVADAPLRHESTARARHPPTGDSTRSPSRPTTRSTSTCGARLRPQAELRGRGGGNGSDSHDERLLAESLSSLRVNMSANNRNKMKFLVRSILPAASMSIGSAVLGLLTLGNGNWRWSDVSLVLLGPCAAILVLARGYYYFLLAKGRPVPRVVSNWIILVYLLLAPFVLAILITGFF